MEGATSFGRWLREQRKARDLTQEDLAERVGCSLWTIQKIEVGTRHPSKQVADILADYLQVPPEEHEPFLRFARGKGTEWLQARDAHTAGGETYGGTSSSPERIAHPNNLPAQVTSFIGREVEVAQLREWLLSGRTRLLTLTGPGGVGKTRLAMQVAASLPDDLADRPYADGVWFVELAALTDHSLVAFTVASVLNVIERPGQAIIDTLKEALRDRQMLLVLDNFEHLMAAAPLVSDLLKAASGVKVLATSREGLHLYGEREFEVAPLQVPDSSEQPGKRNLEPGAFEAVQLFIVRAQDVKADFQLTVENSESVAEICRRLDGLPLAIELAAARVRMFPPQALLSKLASSLDLLTGGARDLPARHQTLRAAIEWSYELLDEGEKRLFRRMAVFRGGRTLEALEAVCNARDEETARSVPQGSATEDDAATRPSSLAVRPLEIDVLQGPEALASKNLLQQREGSNAEPRYWMLETIHDYAWEKLQESGEAQALLRVHARYFMALAEKIEPQLLGGEQVEWLARLEDEHDNIRAALRWTRETSISKDVESSRQSSAEAEDEAEREMIGLRIAGAIWRFWYVRGFLSEGREQLTSVLARRGPGSLEGASTLPGGSERGAAGGEGTAPPETRVTFQTYRAKALNGAGGLALAQGDYASARTLYEESLALRRELGDKQGIAVALNNLGNVAYPQGDYVAARALLEESLKLKREVGDKRGIAHSIHNLGNVAYEQGDYASARTLYEESLALRRELGDKGGVASGLHNLGNVARKQGDFAFARSVLEESLVIYKEIGDKRGISYSIHNLGNVAYEQRDFAAAQALYGESLALRQELGDRHGIAISLAGLGWVALGSAISAQRPGDVAASDKRSTGQDKVARGTRLLAAVQALFETIGVVFDADDRVPYEEAVGVARATLSDEAFNEAWQEGRAMDMEQVIEYALNDR